MEERIVLFVDDEEKILNSLKRELAAEPYIKLFATSGKEALDLLDNNEVQVIVTDMRMPNMDGLELLETVRSRYPHIIRMMLSGYAEVDTLLKAVNEGQIFRFITKPWTMNSDLKTSVRQAIDFYELHNEREVLMDFFELWIEGVEPDLINVNFLKRLVSNRKEHLCEWQRKCESTPLEPESGAVISKT